MPYKNKSSRDYRQEYDEYQGKPEQIKKRAMRNSARAGAVKAGTAKKGDGKDVAHVKALDKGGLNTNGVRIESKSKTVRSCVTLRVIWYPKQAKKSVNALDILCSVCRMEWQIAFA